MLPDHDLGVITAALETDKGIASKPIFNIKT